MSYIVRMYRVVDAYDEDDARTLADQMIEDFNHLLGGEFVGLEEIEPNEGSGEFILPPADVIACGARPNVPLCVNCIDAYRNGIEPGTSACDVRFDKGLPTE